MSIEAGHRVSSVRRVEDEDGVSIHVSRSPHALLGAALIALLPAAGLAAAVTMAVTWTSEASGMPHLSAVALIGIAAIVGIAVVPGLAAAPMVRRLARTGLRGVTFEVDAEQLHVLEFGHGTPRRLTWGREVVLDVIVHHGAGQWLHELHIIVGGEPPVTLLLGAREAELAFLSAELRRALNIDVRRKSVAGWWQDETETSDDRGVDDSLPPILNYAPKASGHAITDRSSDRARIVIPPSARHLLGQLAGPGAAVSIALAAIWWVQLTDQRGAWWNLVWVFYVYPVVIAVTMLRPVLDCFSHRTIEINASEVTLTTRTAFAGVGGQSIKRWPAETVRDVVADGKALVLRLRSSETVTLATCATPAEAAALAEALHPPPPAIADDSAPDDQTPPEPPHLSANST